MRKRLAVAIPAVVAAFSFSAALRGQDQSQTAPQPAAASAHNAAADHGISGVWNAMRGNYDVASFSKGNPPMTMWGQAQYDAAKPSQGPRGVSLAETTDRVYKCVPAGMPYIYLQLFPVQIVKTPKAVIEIFESDHTVRYIYTDGRQHPAKLKPTYNGHSIGHWEGNTLVVDTIGLSGKLWLDRVGHPDSEQMHITERIYRVDDKTLQVDFTFDDPKSYVQPWTALMRFRLQPKWDIQEDVCTDNIAFESFEK
ncbi:MAG: hypothetical protein LAO08_17785 [Acidobacteriia bacterium]|nr:hypothetical protein [Terriglobia bacterium]